MGPGGGPHSTWDGNDIFSRVNADNGGFITDGAAGLVIAAVKRPGSWMGAAGERLPGDSRIRCAALLTYIWN